MSPPDEPDVRSSAHGAPPPTARWFVAPDGTRLAPCPSAVEVDAGALVALDGSSVRYRVRRVEADEVVVEIDWSHRGAPATTQLVAPLETRRVASSGGVELALHHFGGSGPVLLIAHATGFHGPAYAPFARVLSCDFDVWAVDFRGHGASTAPLDGDFAWVGMGEDVLATVDHLGVDSVVAFGHSMGGAALLLAELARPGVIGAAYLFEPIVFPEAHVDGPDENPMSGPARRRRPTFGSRAEVHERYASKPPLSALRVDALAAYVEHGFVDTDDGEVRLACEPEHEARTFEAEDKMTVERLGGLSTRITVAHGVLDDRPAQIAPVIAEATPGAVLRPHPELGHFGPLEDPDAVAADVVDALG